MPWNGTGSFTRAFGATGWVDDRNASTFILASRHDTHDQDLATGIGLCMTTDNQSKPAATITPNLANTYDLGSTALSWRNLIANGLKLLNSGFATTFSAATLTANRTVTVPDADVNLTGINSVYFAIKQGDTTRTSTVTYTNDTELAFTNVPAGSYDVEIYMMPFQNGVGAIGFKWALASGGFASIDYGLVVNQSINNSITTRANVLAMSTGLAYAQVFTSVNDYVFIKGTVILTGTASVALQWAQNTLSVNFSALGKGSMLRLVRK